MLLSLTDKCNSNEFNETKLYYVFAMASFFDDQRVKIIANKKIRRTRESGLSNLVKEDELLSRLNLKVLKC